MAFSMFRRSRRNRDAESKAVYANAFSGITLTGKKKQRQTSGLKRLLRKSERNHPYDATLDNHDDSTEQESFSSSSNKSSSSSNNSSNSNNSSSNNNSSNHNNCNYSCNGDKKNLSCENNGYRYDSNENKVAEVGSPPKRLLRRKERMTFKIHGFTQCAETRGQYRLTPTLQAHGYNWRLQVYPRGDNRSNETREYVSCFLHYFASPNDRKPPVVKVEYNCGAYKTATQVCTFAIEKDKCSTSWGLEDFVRRDKVIRNYLDEDGALSIEVDIQIAVDRTFVWYPPFMRQEPTLVQLYNSMEENGDVAFCLTNSNKHEGKSWFRRYKAHKMILALRARILYDLVCEDESEDDHQDCDSNAVDVPDIDSETFEAMLEHIYTVRQPIIRDEAEAKRLLAAADRFCLTDLKLYVESVLTDRFAVSSSAASMLLFADAHSCALLKEAAMDLCVSDPHSVSQSPSWAMVEESERLVSELSGHVHTGCRKSFQNSHSHPRGDDVESGAVGKDESQGAACFPNENDMDVFSIRERLCEHGLDLDGSRETLLKRLEHHWNKGE